MLLPKPTPRFYAWACVLCMLLLIFCMTVAKLLVYGLPFGDTSGWWSAPILIHDAGLMVMLYLMLGCTIATSIEVYRHWALVEREGGAEEEQTPFLRGV